MTRDKDRIRRKAVRPALRLLLSGGKEVREARYGEYLKVTGVYRLTVEPPSVLCSEV